MAAAQQNRDQLGEVPRPFTRRVRSIVLLPFRTVLRIFKGLVWLGESLTGTNERGSWQLQISLPLEIGRLGMTVLLIAYVFRAENVFTLLGPGFVSVATLALLCFTYVQALGGDSSERTQVLLVGRHFMLAAGLLLVLAPLVLIVDGLFNWAAVADTSRVRDWLAWMVFMLFVFPLSFVAVRLVADGVVTLVRTLLPPPPPPPTKDSPGDVEDHVAATAPQDPVVDPASRGAG